MNINTIWLKHSLRAMAIAGATVAFLFCAERWAPKINTQWLDVSKQIIQENIQFSDLFLYFHRHTDVPMYEGRQVVLLDIHDYQTREEVATLLDSVVAAEPYMVALDVIFGKISMPDSTENSHLVSAVQRLPNLILATEQLPVDETHYRYERSFFADEVQATEAIVNFPTGILRKWSPLQTFNGDTFPTFAYAIMEKMGISVPEIETEWLIDYSIADTSMMHPNRKPFNWAFLRNQVVIIGDAHDLRDLKSVPYAYRVSTRMAGVQVHKQIVQTAIAHHWFRRCHEAWLWIITFLFLWGILMITPLASALAYTAWKPMQSMYGRIFKHDTEGLPLVKWEKTVRKIMKTVFVILFLAFAYILFWGAHLYFSVATVVLAAPVTLWVGSWLTQKIKGVINLFRKL